MDDDDTSTSGTIRGPGKPPPPGASVPAEDAEPEKVGYGKPPKATRFKPGQSGNPRGRRKGSRNLRTYLREELETRVTVGKDGRQQKLPKVHLIAKQLVNAAAGGDLKSIECLVRLVDLMQPERLEGEVVRPMSEEDQKTIRDYLQSINVTKKTEDKT